MILRLLTGVFLLPILLSAQDFTRFSTSEESDALVDSLVQDLDATLLVLPYHPHYHISEVDRMMTADQMEVPAMREKLRKVLTRSLTQALGDSLNAIDLSIAMNSDIDICEYMYNAIDYNYAARPEEIDSHEKRTRLLEKMKLKKKESKSYGAYSEQKEGQLQRKEVLHDRFMAAQIGNKGALEYLHDLYAHDALLSITQLEITRSHDSETQGSYVLNLHYTLLDAGGQTRYGNKETMVLSPAKLDWDTFNDEVLPAFSKSLAAKLLTKMDESPAISIDNPDY